MKAKFIQMLVALVLATVTMLVTGCNAGANAGVHFGIGGQPCRQRPQYQVQPQMQMQPQYQTYRPATGVYVAPAPDVSGLLPSPAQPQAQMQSGRQKLMLNLYCSTCGKYYMWNGGELAPGLQLFAWRPDLGKWWIFDGDYRQIMDPRHFLESTVCPVGHPYQPTNYR